MILSTASPLLVPGGPLLLVGLAALLYLLAALPLAALRRLSVAALLGGFVLHALLLAVDVGGFGQHVVGARLGFGPVLSMTVWLVIAVYAVESRLVPLPAVRQWLGLAGVGAVALAALFPGEPRVLSSTLAPLHFALGVGSYGLFGAAVLHALLLDAAERRLRAAAPLGKGVATPATVSRGMPLLQLERVTFRFVEAGFAVLTAALVLGIVTTVQWRWGDHKAVFSLLAWGVFAALLMGRRRHGWRGHQATRWLYVGAGLLLLAYAGSRFVVEVLLDRSV
ncbi:MAG: cytochrome c biogenesis protein CcsA [Rubrivivax sp.]|nr:cytochrome c biogenesis protein CcsA [Rubrivivax sp.]